MVILFSICEVKFCITIKVKNTKDSQINTTDTGAVLHKVLKVALLTPPVKAIIYLLFLDQFETSWFVQLLFPYSPIFLCIL